METFLSEHHQIIFEIVILFFLLGLITLTMSLHRHVLDLKREFSMKKSNSQSQEEEMAALDLNKRLEQLQTMKFSPLGKRLS